MRGDVHTAGGMGVKVASVVGVVLTALYPIAAYFGLARVSARPLAAGMAAILTAGALLRARGKRREHALAVVRIAASVVLLLLVGAVVDDRRFVLALPVLTNAVLLAYFAASLRTTPIAERFARAKEDDLSAAQIGYCRGLTIVWCVFFVVNGAITAILALLAPLAWWTLYSSLLAYLLVGLLASGEYVVRKARFRRYDDSPVDRLIARLFPPALTGPSAVTGPPPSVLAGRK
jgi:uncharacterized membrane protein